MVKNAFEKRSSAGNNYLKKMDLKDANILTKT